MKKTFITVIIPFCLLLLSLTSCDAPQTSQDTRAEQELLFTAPALTWEETLPLGNGRLGMMPDGGIACETITLNEISLWSGSEFDYGNPEAARSLPRIRQLLLAGKNKEAQELMYKTFVPFHPAGSDPYGTLQTLGNLILDYVFPENDQEIEAVQNYRRTLDLSRATASTLFTQGGVEYIRDYFVSRTGDVMIIRIGTGQKEPQQAISFSAILQRPEQAYVYSIENSLVMEGTLDSGIPEQEGMKYYTKMQIATDGGTVTINEDHIQVKEANEAIIYLTATTSYMNDNYQEDAERLLKTARKANYSDLLSDHIKSYQEFYNRVRLSIGSSRAPKRQLPDKTTDQRILSFREDDDPALATLYYNFGRYLLSSSGRGG
ncbi:MAG: glycoside hydrolase family 95 protein, partial [Bacteroides sp.]|nr:glycoside hydrolase family 95 protein [Bacteroides sp.]